MIKINRKAVIIAGLAILLAVTGLLNLKLANDESKKTADLNNQQQADDVQTGNAFKDFRTERERVRTQEITHIDSIINNENTDQETLSEAQTMKLEIVDTMEKELLMEGLLKAKGFEDAVITIGGETVNVVVKDSDLSQAEVAQILEVVMRETNAKTEDIAIIQAA